MIRRAAAALGDPNRLPRFLAAAFALYGLIAVAALAVEMPPFQNPDEPSHFLRAEQVARGGVIGRRLDIQLSGGRSRPTSGGRGDPAIIRAWVPFYPLIEHPELRVTPSMWVPQVGWTDEKFNMIFDNTALYPPVFYLPSAVGVLVGRAAGMTVVRTLVLSRVLTGIVAVAVGAAAIACAEAVSVVVFAIMTLPMSLALLASGSQDALLLACSALAAGLYVRFWWRDAAPGRAELVVATVLLCLICTARPPYLGLALLPLTVATVPMRWRVVSMAAVVLSVAAWSTLAAIATYTPSDVAGADPAAQAGLLLHDPLNILRIAFDTLQTHGGTYIRGFVGVLGWQDTELPTWYHVVAWIVLGLAATATMLAERQRPIGTVSHIVLGAGVLLSAAAVLGVEYLTWTSPGALVVEGVQGRYFLPLVLPAAVALPALGAARHGSARGALTLVVALFPVITIGETLRAIVLRYYVG